MSSPNRVATAQIRAPVAMPPAAMMPAEREVLIAVRETARKAGPGLATTNRWTMNKAANAETPWLKSVIEDSLDRFRTARDRDHAGARNLHQAKRLHQIDEGRQLLGRAGHLEHEGYDGRIHDAGADDIDDAQGFDPLLAGAIDLHQY